MLLPWAWIIFGSAITAFALVVFEGGDVTLSCAGSQIAYPEWQGPGTNGVKEQYNYHNSSVFSPKLGEKSGRLIWNLQNNKDLILQKVIKNDTGKYTCIDGDYRMIYSVLVRVMSQQPVISNQESIDHSRSVVRGAEGKSVSLICTSTGGYPKPNLKWYRDNTSTQSLVSVETTRTNDDNNYIVEQNYTFTPKDLDDQNSFLCQSSFDPPKPSFRSAVVILYLNLKPSKPSVTLYPLTEGIPNKVADCRTCQFRPKSAQAWLQIEGNKMPTVQDITFSDDDLTETFSLTVSYSGNLSRDDNGKKMVCHIEHETLHTSLTGSDIIVVNFRPLTVQLTGATSNIIANAINIISLNCTSGTSNPSSLIKWFRGNKEVVNTGAVQEAVGEFNGTTKSQILQIIPTRSMDGQEVYCSVHNSVAKQNPINSTVKTLDLLYSPIITSISLVQQAVEGKNATIRCDVHAKPSANVTWYYNSDVVQTERPTVNHIGEFSIPTVKRTHSGTYKCVAKNGYLPDWTNETDLVVRYTPDVQVITRNVTVNDAYTVLACRATGVPEVYTYSEWQHIWPGFGSITHSVTLGNKPTLNLTSLTYEYSGIYKCAVSNGVVGSLNSDAGYGNVYLKVETYPIITNLSSKKVSAQLNRNTSTTIHFYSNRNDNKVECKRIDHKHDCFFVIQKEQINLPVFGYGIQTEGLAAHITFAIQDMDHFGALTINISNGIGGTTMNITVVPEGPPERPHSIGIGDISSTSVTISWIPGFHGGFDQTFLLQYSSTADTWDQYNNDTVNGGKTDGLLNANISGLQSETRYFFRLLAYTSKGYSGFTDVYNFSTAGQETKKSHSEITAILAGSAATGALALIACSVGLVLSVVRYRRKKDELLVETKIHSTKTRWKLT